MSVDQRDPGNTPAMSPEDFDMPIDDFGPPDAVQDQQPQDTPDQGEPPVDATPSPEPEPMRDEPAPEPVQQTPEPEPVDDLPSFPEHLLRAAGISADEAARQYASAEEMAFVLHDRQMLQAARQAQFNQMGRQAPQQPGFQQAPQNIPPGTQFPQQPNQMPQQQPPMQGQPAQDPQQQQGQSPFGQFQLPEPADGVEWDENTVKLVESINGHWEKVLSGIVPHVAQMQQFQQELQRERVREQQRQIQEYVHQFDEAVGELGAEYEELFGKGSGYEVDDLYKSNRVRVDQALMQMNMARQANGFEPLAITKDSLARAVRVEFPDFYQKQVQQQVAGGRRRRSRSWTARPSARRGTGPTAEDRAGDVADQWYADHKVPAPDNSSMIPDEL